MDLLKNETKRYIVTYRLPNGDIFDEYVLSVNLSSARDRIRNQNPDIDVTSIKIDESYIPHMRSMYGNLDLVHPPSQEVLDAVTNVTEAEQKLLQVCDENEPSGKPFLKGNRIHVQRWPDRPGIQCKVESIKYRPYDSDKNNLFFGKWKIKVSPVVETVDYEGDAEAFWLTREFFNAVSLEPEGKVL